jgi:hypothetical protein
MPEKNKVINIAPSAACRECQSYLATKLLTQIRAYFVGISRERAADVKEKFVQKMPH